MLVMSWLVQEVFIINIFKLIDCASEITNKGNPQYTYHYFDNSKSKDGRSNVSSLSSNSHQTVIHAGSNQDTFYRVTQQQQH